MLLAHESSLEEKVVERLLESPYQVKRLHVELSKQGRVSLKAVYNAVNALIAEGVVVKAGKVVQIDQEWLRALRASVTKAAPLELGAGEKAVYAFSSFAHLDQFWKTLALQLESLEQDAQIFFYNPHDFWAYVPERVTSEDAYYRHFEKQGVHAFFTIGGTNEADMAFKRRYQNEFLQIDARDMPGMSRTEHVTVLGDFIISVRIPRTLAVAIDNLYASAKSEAEVASSIPKLLEGSQRVRLSIEHSRAKAQKIRRKLSLNFYFWRPS